MLIYIGCQRLQSGQLFEELTDGNLESIGLFDDTYGVHNDNGVSPHFQKREVLIDVSRGRFQRIRSQVP